MLESLEGLMIAEKKYNKLIIVTENLLINCKSTFKGNLFFLDSKEADL